LERLKLRQPNETISDVKQRLDEVHRQIVAYQREKFQLDAKFNRMLRDNAKAQQPQAQVVQKATLAEDMFGGSGFDHTNPLNGTDRTELPQEFLRGK